MGLMAKLAGRIFLFFLIFFLLGFGELEMTGSSDSVMTLFCFLVLFFLDFGGAGGGVSESYTVSLHVCCMCPNWPHFCISSFS